MTQDKATQTDQADHSQVQSSENEQRALQQGIPEILKNLIRPGFISCNHEIVQRIYMFFVGKKDFLYDLKTNNDRALGDIKTFRSDLDKKKDLLDSSTCQFKDAAHLVTLNENYHTNIVTLKEKYNIYIVTLIKKLERKIKELDDFYNSQKNYSIQKDELLDCVVDVNVKGKIDRFESMQSSEPTEVTSEAESSSIKQEIEPVLVEGKSSFKSKPYRSESMKSSEPTEVTSEAQNYSIKQEIELIKQEIELVSASNLEGKVVGVSEQIEAFDIKTRISEWERIIEEAQEVKAKIEELEKGIKQSVVENNASCLNSDPCDPKEQNAKKSGNIKLIANNFENKLIKKNMKDFPFLSMGLKRNIDKLSKDSKVVLKELECNNDDLEESLKREIESKRHELSRYRDSSQELLKVSFASFRPILKSIYDVFHVNCKNHEILRYKDMFKDFLDKYGCFDDLGSDIVFKPHFLENFSKYVMNLQESLSSCILNLNMDNFDIILLSAKIKDLELDLSDLNRSLKESLELSEVSEKEQSKFDLEMIKDYISVVLDFCKNFKESNLSLEDLPKNFKESISLCKDRYPKILNDLSAFSKHFEKFSKTLKSVKDSSTSNNPVHEDSSSTCQAVADINPASNSESISHSNPDEKKEIKEEAPSSNLAGCENEIVHSTNSENLSQI